MKYENDQWYEANYPHIKSHKTLLSQDGLINDERNTHLPDYISSNGYVYAFIKLKSNKLILVPFDKLFGLTFIPIPQNLIGKPITINHKNGILNDNNIDNLEWIEEIEIWKTIDLPDIKQNYYEVSNLGKIRNKETGDIFTYKPDTSGYIRLSLSQGVMYNKPKHYNLHRLVAMYFVPGRSNERDCVNHIDGNKTNNHYMNLEWVTNQENLKHASLSQLLPRGDTSPVSVISEKDAVLICKLLNKYRGSINDVYNKLKYDHPKISRPLIASIKYKKTFTYISDKILDDNVIETLARRTEEDLILDAARCLKKYNGDVRKTKMEFSRDHPWVTYGWLWHLKDKSVGSEITDRIFKIDEFPKGREINEDEAVLIIKALIKYKSERYVNQKVYDELKDDIDRLTKDKIRAIKEKKSFKYLSDKYFTRADFGLS